MGISFVGSLVNLFLITPFVAGAMAVFLRKVSNDENPQLEAFSEAKDYMPNLVIYNLLYTLMMMLCFLPVLIFMAKGGFFNMAFSAIDDPSQLLQQIRYLSDGSTMLIVLLCMIPFAYLAVAYWWTPYLIVYEGMSPWPAMELSRKLVTKEWGYHFLLALIVGAVAMVLGFLSVIFSFSLYLGLAIQTIIGIVIAAIFSCALFSGYEEIVGFDEGEGESDLIDHLVS